MEVKPLNTLKKDAITVATKELLLGKKSITGIPNSPGFYVSTREDGNKLTIGKKFEINTPEGKLEFFILQET